MNDHIDDTFRRVRFGKVPIIGQVTGHPGTHKKDHPTPLSEDLVSYLRYRFDVTGKDDQTDCYPLLEYRVTIPWGDLDVATPLKDFETIRTLTEGGTYAFDYRASAYVNHRTFSLLNDNRNMRDLLGKRTLPAGVMHLVRLEDVARSTNTPALTIMDPEKICQWKSEFPDNEIAIVGYTAQRLDYSTDECPEWAQPGRRARCYPFVVIMRV